MRPAKRLRLFGLCFGPAAILVLAAACIGRAGQPIPPQATPTITALPANSTPLVPGAPPTGTTLAPAGTQASAGTETPNIRQVHTPTPAAAYQPPQGEGCLLLADHVMDIVGAQQNMIQTGNAPFHEPVKNESGAGCQILIRGSGAGFRNFKNIQGMAEACQSQLPDGGWKIDPSYASVTASAITFAARRGKELALFSIQGEAAPGAPVCPVGQSLDQCQLKPGQIQLVIRINYAVHS